MPFSAPFPADAAIEQDHPRTFDGMYNFWCRKIQAPGVQKSKAMLMR